ncbi:neprilysin-11-like isoform X2 [Toxorhynchites rutilus septentrionalis]|uniref:neprilysin-11-like isoform X2 n=1 Tax=Toxorhynchites rutilus septentrionalis TaxID=329112 RepID=UPI00247B21C1|nr:neprilysin-11-like isoform X2 [Toxorhynchites rutilus septentrionalis]
MQSNIDYYNQYLSSLNKIPTMEGSPPNNVMVSANNVEEAPTFKSIGSKLRPLLNRSKDGSYRVFCRRSLIFILLVAIVLLSSIIHIIHRYVRTRPNICHSKECLRAAAALKQNMNPRVDPCDDFYSYVCGNWADDHPRPKSHDSYNWYSERASKVYRNVRDHLETNITRSDPKPVAQAKTMYKACLNNADPSGEQYLKRTLKELGLPVYPSLLNLTKTPNQTMKFDWISSVAKIQRKLSKSVFIGFDIVPDHTNKSRNRLSLGYHLLPHMLNISAFNLSDLVLIKDGSSEENDDYISSMELSPGDIEERMLFLATEFTEFHNRLPNRTKSNETNIGYYTLQELQMLTDQYIAPREPLPFWQCYMDTVFAGIPEAMPTAEDKLQIDELDIEYLKKLIDVISREEPARIEVYVWINVVLFLFANFFVRAEGEQECSRVVQELMPPAVIHMIAKEDFLTKTKPRVKRMLREIRREFDQMVLNTDWMDVDTKNATLEKSKATISLIGHQEWFLDTRKLEQHYRGLQISDSNHLENCMNANQLLNSEKLRTWRDSNARDWTIHPLKVNAQYNFEHNVITIPVSMIQYPFYYLGLEALNYGGLGSTLGHELTHGFDRDGIRFDKHGNRESWWSVHSLQKYDERAACFVQQYNRYYVPEAKGFVNGNLTLGENIADNGGLREAFHAYQTYVKQHGPEPILPGFEEFTHNQLFFLSFGNICCGTLPLNASKGILDDVHSPFKFRVQGTLSNMEEFSAAFKCPLGSFMNPKNKCRIW